MTEDQSKTPPEKQEKPRIFLYLAALMIVLAVAAYAMQGSLLGRAGSWTTFLFALVLPVLMALYFLYCYRVPRYGLKLLGRSIELGDPGEKTQGLSYNVFKGESAIEEKLAQTRRKTARHLRRKLARATPKPGAAPEPDGEDSP